MKLLDIEKLTQDEIVAKLSGQEAESILDAYYGKKKGLLPNIERAISSFNTDNSEKQVSFRVLRFGIEEEYFKKECELQEHLDSINNSDIYCLNKLDDTAITKKLKEDESLLKRVCSSNRYSYVNIKKVINEALVAETDKELTERICKSRVKES